MADASGAQTDTVDGFNIGWNCGEVAQADRDTPAHLIPRRKAMLLIRRQVRRYYLSARLLVPPNHRPAAPPRDSSTNAKELVGGVPILLCEFLDTGYRACQSIQTRPKVRVIQGLLSSVCTIRRYLGVLRIVDVDQCA